MTEEELDQKMIREIEAYGKAQSEKMEAEIKQGLWVPAGKKLTLGIYVRHNGTLWRKPT